MATIGAQNGVRPPVRGKFEPEEDEEVSQDEELVPASPYTTRAVTVVIGTSGARYTVLQAIIDQYPGLKDRVNPRKPDAPIDLREVDEEVGHTLIHYLYTRQYQTLSQESLPIDERVPMEFKLALLAYAAAKLCGIQEFEELAKAKIDKLSKGLSLFDIQRVTEEVAGKLPRHGDWFAAQVDSWVKVALVAADTLLADERIVDRIGRNAVFDKALVKSLTEMYLDLKYKAKQPTLAGSKPDLEQEQAPLYAGASGSASMEVGSDSGKPTGVVPHGTPTYDANQHRHQNGTALVRHDSVVSRASDTALPPKPDIREMSPMPSEEPSSFEALSPSTEKKESLVTQHEELAKNTDSEDEIPSKLPVAKKPKKKKGKKIEG